MSNSTYTIQQLEKVSGLPRRTIRFYTVRGLLPPAHGSKRGSYYDDKHVEGLKRIRRLVSEGYPLVKIKELLNPDTTEVSTPEPKTLLRPRPEIERKIMERVEVAPGVELSFKPGRWSDSELQEIVDFFRKLSDSRESKEQ